MLDCAVSCGRADMFVEEAGGYIACGEQRRQGGPGCVVCGSQVPRSFVYARKQAVPLIYCWSEMVCKSGRVAQVGATVSLHL